MILIIYAHPYPRHSHANQRLLQAVRDLPEVEVRSLYELYPDFNIDINAEQRRWRAPTWWCCSIRCSGTASRRC